MNPSKTSFSSLVVEYHKLYALTKKPEYLEMAAALGKVKDDTYEETWQKKVNAGCIREGLPLRYPQAGTPLPTTKDVE